MKFLLHSWEKVKEMYRFVIAVVLAACIVLVAGCVSTNVPRGDRDEIRGALTDQRKLAVDLYLQRLVRVNELAIPILKANNEICDVVAGYRIGVTILTKRSLPYNMQQAAEREFGIGSRPVIYIVPGTPAANSELRSGDRLYRINDTSIGDNIWSRKTAHNVLKAALRSGEDITLRVMRRGSHDQIVSVLKPEPMCQSFVYLIQDSTPNAFADGQDIFVNTGLLKEAENDREVQVVLAHELAHNAKSHVAKSGGIGLLGSVLDALVFDEDDKADGVISDLAVRAFSPGFEREADYVGIYMLARAGLDTENAAAFWRRLAVEYPEDNKKTILGTHPMHTERFVSMEMAHEEIEAKRRDGSPLIPEAR